MKAVIIDGHNLFSHAIIHLLQTCVPGIEIIGKAKNKITAVPLLQSLTPDIVLLDVDLKDGTGPEVLCAMKSFGYDVIFCSVYDESDQRVQAIRIAGFPYFLKGEDLDEMIASINGCRYGKYTIKSMSILCQLLDAPEGDTDVEMALPMGRELTFLSIRSILKVEADPHSQVPITLFTIDREHCKRISTRRFSCFQPLLNNRGFAFEAPATLVNTRLNMTENQDSTGLKGVPDRGG